MYTETKLFKFLYYGSLSLFLIVLMLYTSLSYFVENLHLAFSISIYAFLIYVYAFFLYTLMVQVWPHKRISQLNKFNGVVNNLKYDTFIVGSGKNQSRQHEYTFTLGVNGQRCYFVRPFRLKINDNDTITLAALPDINKIWVVALKNHATNQLRSSNLFTLVVGLLAILTIVGSFASMIILVNRYDLSFLLYAGAFLVNAALIPVVMFGFRRIDLYIAGMFMAGSEKN